MRSADGALDTLSADGVDCLLLEPDRPLVAQAVAAGWQVTARDDARVLLVAPQLEPTSWIPPRPRAGAPAGRPGTG